jgi:hypothetical protein
MAGIDQGREQKSSESTDPSWKVTFPKKSFVPYIYENGSSLLSKAFWAFFSRFLVISCEKVVHFMWEMVTFLWGALLPVAFLGKKPFLDKKMAEFPV